jgi:hypothetical protein
MAIVSPVRADLRQILLTQPGIPGDIAWEGRKFTPTAGIRWLGEFLVPLRSEPASLGKEGYTREVMAYSITVNEPPNSVGLSQQEDLLDALRYAYPVGRHIGGVNVFGRVMSTSRTRIVTGADWRSGTVTAIFWVMAPTQLNPPV